MAKRKKSSAPRSSSRRGKSTGKPSAKSGRGRPSSSSKPPRSPSARKKSARKKTTRATVGDERSTSPSADAAKHSKSAPPRTGSSRNKPQRLQRLLAAAGYGSRRQCETLIQEGRVEVDGETVVELGTTVDPKSNKVRVDGVELRQQKLVYYAVNKPTGVLSTNADPRGRQRVIDLVPRSERVFPVGRLDQSSQGLMLLTNDGDLAQQLAHPKYGVRKIYRVTVAGKIDGETMKNMRKGIYISDGFVRVEGARILRSRSRATDLEITLREGKNREIRRILARLGHKVQTLQRIAIGPLRLGDMPVGAYRPLTRDEVDRLRKSVEHSRHEVDDASDSKRRSSGGKKRTATKKRGGGRSEVRSKRTARKKSATKVTFKPRTPKDGSVIGGD